MIYRVNLMQNSKRRRIARVPEIRLTDALPRVVSRRQRKNRLYQLLTSPIRLMVRFWHWLMESRPSSNHRLRREPPGFY